MSKTNEARDLKIIERLQHLSESKRLFASKYKLYLPTEKELKEELEREKRMIEMELKLLESKGKK
ncbi:MAG: hypothetical protein KJ739_00470 [Nitrospinae bacterium]|nr:hypothetical protein [Nitrospinota bacterium]